MRVCDLTGKRAMTGHHVSHSNIKTLRKFNPNLQKKRFFVPELNLWVTFKVSTSAMRSINKMGIYNFVRKMEKKSGNKIFEKGIKNNNNNL